MCGIVGWIDYKRNVSGEADTIKAMAEKLSNRGPDASGYWFSNQAALGHRRLTVVDPEGGRQPMLRKAGNDRYALVYNGELYNTEEIRGELIRKGYMFEGWSDTEVLLASYIEWGEECPEKLNGIFAFAVWDEKKSRLFLARDRIGVKPLFYCVKGSSFLFASEIKAILAHPEITPKLGRRGLAEIFAVGPARTPGEGVFSGIYELKPGYSMMLDGSGYRTKQYWRLNSHSHEEDFDHTVSRVRELVYDSVKRQLVSDVPLCTLLSGGLDSSAITAIASDVYRNENKDPIRTFSIDYVGNHRYFQASLFQPDEDAPWVTKVADYLGTKHSSFFIDTPELAEAVFPAVLARDLPGMADIDSSLLLFSKWVKERATVGLSGECADEVFGGYPWFFRTNNGEGTLFPWNQRVEERMELYSSDLLFEIQPHRYLEDRYREAICEVPRLESDSPEDSSMRELFYLNLTRWMPTLLDRKDRMSMAAGLELRVPFCDHRIVEYVWNIPWEMKRFRGREKGLLRQALTGMLPEDVLWRKKSPYPKTHNPSYIEAIRNMTLTMLEDRTSPLLELINRKTVKELALSLTKETDIPWFGQLMNAPQLLVYLLQIDFWLKEYRIVIE